MAFIEPIPMLTQNVNQSIVQVGSVFHPYLPFICGELKKDSLFSGFEKHSRKRFVSQSGQDGQD
jgi:hypothetical protein